MGYDELEELIQGNGKMTIEPYNYNDEPSGRSETLVQLVLKLSPKHKD